MILHSLVLRTHLGMANQVTFPVIMQDQRATPQGEIHLI